MLVSKSVDAMTKKDDKHSPAQAAAAARAQRLAEELRGNLRKRKEKARALNAPKQETESSGPPSKSQN
jgi:hypothetical protein